MIAGDHSSWTRRNLLGAGAGLLAALTTPVLAACSDNESGTRGESDTSGAPGTSGASGSDGVTTTSGRPALSDPATVEFETPYITPSDQFFRIDTAVTEPRLSVDEWSLRVHGLVDRPLTLRYADLARFTRVERTVTLACVSNNVGGRLVGNAVWSGVLLADVLREASVQPAAEQLFSTSVDGWTCGFPVGAATDNRDALIATHMNGEPLTAEHGFPARLVVPGLYGYVSATKWVTDIELTTWDAQNGYWTTRGWSVLAPIKPQSRIDAPRRSDGLTPGPIVLGGVAWAPRSGVARVEVRIDDGPWLATVLDHRGSGDTWRQWHYVWQAERGTHRVSVRVTNGDGEVQTDAEAPPDPDGATGLHTRRFTIR